MLRFLGLATLLGAAVFGIWVLVRDDLTLAAPSTSGFLGYTGVTGSPGTVGSIRSIGSGLFQAP